VVVGSILGAQGLLRDKGGTTSRPAGTQSVTTRTALIQGFTVTSPSDWTLIDEWPGSRPVATSSNAAGSVCPEANPTPPPACTSTRAVLQLSNFDPGLARSLCGDTVLQSTEAGLYVGLVGGSTVAADIDSFPSSLDVSSPPADGPCGSGVYASFTSNGSVYLAFAAFGADVSEADRQQVLDTFNALSPVSPGIGDPTVTTPGYVLAAGTTDSGEPWVMEVRPSEQESTSRLPLQLSIVHADGKGSEFFTFGEPTIDQIPNGRSSGVWYGVVPADTTSLEFQSTDGSRATAVELFDIPLSLDVSGSAFAFSVPDGLDGQLTGSTPTSGFAIGTATAVAPSPVNEPPTGGSSDPGTTGLQIASGTDLGTSWTLTADPTGKAHFSLAPTTTNANNFVVAVTPGQDLDYAGVPAPEGAFMVAVAPSGAGAISVRLADGTAIEGRSYPAPKEIGKDQTFWVIVLPGSGQGTLESESGGAITTTTWQPAVFAGG
jgi:hypothetical protein